MVDLNVYMLQVIGSMSLATIICRFLPFFLPEFLIYHRLVQSIAKVLPSVILVVLVANELLPKGNEGLKNMLCEIFATLVVIITHFKFRNALLSIGLGTLLFVFLKNGTHFFGG